jgi:hypothetical protein
MVNLYLVVGVPNESEIEVRPRDHKETPNPGDVVFPQEEPAAKVTAAVDERTLGVGDFWSVYLDRRVRDILIGNLVGIGIP